MLPGIGPMLPKAREQFLVEQKKNSAAAVAASKPAATIPAALNLSGTFSGKFVEQSAAGAGPLTLKGGETTIALNPFSISGSAIGAVVSGKSTGTIKLTNNQGSMTLALSAAVPANATTVPNSFAFTVSGGSGAYKNSSGSGTLDLTLYTSKVNTSGTFSLTL